MGVAGARSVSGCLAGWSTTGVKALLVEISLSNATDTTLPMISYYYSLRTVHTL